MIALPAWVAGPVVKAVGTLLLVTAVLGYVYHRGGDGPRAELEGYLAVQKVISEQEVALRKRLKNNVERSNAESLRRNAVLSVELGRLQRELASRPEPQRIATPPETRRPDLVAFDRAEFDRAMAERARGERAFEEAVLRIVGAGAKAVVDLDSAKEWARGDQ